MPFFAQKPFLNFSLTCYLVPRVSQTQGEGHSPPDRQVGPRLLTSATSLGGPRATLISEQLPANSETLMGSLRFYNLLELVIKLRKALYLWLQSYYSKRILQPKEEIHRVESGTGKVPSSKLSGPQGWYYPPVIDVWKHAYGILPVPEAHPSFGLQSFYCGFIVQAWSVELLPM